MRSVAVATALLLISTIKVAGQTIPADAGFGRRIGPGLDSAGCAYFGLFPEIRGVAGARLEERADGARLTVARSGGAGDTTLMLTSAQVHQLRAYIDRFELLFRNPAEVRIDSIRQLVRPARPFAGSGASYRIIDRRGIRHEGAMLYAGDSLVLLGKGMDQYDWWRVEDSVAVLRPEEIETIERAGSIPAALGIGILAAAAAGPGYGYVIDHSSAEVMAAGAVCGIGAGLGMYDQTSIDMPVGGNRIMYDRVLPAMMRDALFGAQIPPELEQALRRRDERALAALPGPVSIDELAGRNPLPRFSVHYAAGIPLYRADNAIPIHDSLWKTSGTGQVNEMLFFRRIGVGYGITDRIGVSIEHLSAEMSSYSFTFNGAFQILAYKVPTAARENYRYQTFRVTGTYALLTPDFVRGQRLWMSVGAGAGYSPVTVESALYTESNDGTRSLRVTRTASYSTSAMSGHLLAEIGYRPVRIMSIFAAFDATFAGGAAVPGWSFSQKLEPEDPFTPVVSMGTSEHRIDVSAGGVLLGARLHF